MGFISIKSKNIIYLNMPKSGCTTIKNHLNFIETGKWLPDPLTIHKKKNGLLKSKYKEDQDEIDGRLQNSFTFTFVRNPANRIYSLYCEKIRTNGKYSFPRITEYLKSNYSYKENKALSLKQERQNYLSFLIFVDDNIKRKTDFRLDPHWLPQTTVIRRNTKTRMIDFIGKIENFGIDIRFVFNKIGIYEHDFDIRLNKIENKIFSLEEIGTKEIRDLTDEIYQKDIQALGY